VRQLHFKHYALSISTAAALLVACGGSQPPIRVPGAMPQSHAIVGHGKTRQASGNPLLYVSDPHDYIYIFNYPGGTYATSFSPEALAIDGLCTDGAGDVFVAAYADYGLIFKYAHGAVSPSATLKEYGVRPYGCAVDFNSGNLAVGNYSPAGDNVGVFPGGSGSPSYYPIANTNTFPLYCSYDGSGNLFVDADSTGNTTELLELAAGASAFVNVTVSKRIRPGPLQWVAPYLTVADSQKVYRLRISGSNAAVVGSTSAIGGKPHPWIDIANKTLIEPYGRGGTKIGYWRYPKGGKPFLTFGEIDKNFEDLNGVVISVASGPLIGRPHRR